MFHLDKTIEQKLQNMPNKRSKHAQVALGNYVYVIGGIGTRGAMKSVDKFNLYSEK